jgi:hypothetical protein
MNVIVEYETEIPAAVVPLLPDRAIQLRQHPPYASSIETSFLSAGGGTKGYLIFSFDSANPTPTFKILRKNFGTIHLYGPLQTRRRPGGLWWDHVLLPGAAPIFSRTLTRTLNAYLDRKAADAGTVKFGIHGQLPVMRYTGYAPDYWVRAAIDGEFSLAATTARARVGFELTGEHDGFPKHIIRINGKEVYVHDPLRTGDSPLALMGGMERRVALSGPIS